MSEGLGGLLRKPSICYRIALCEQDTFYLVTVKILDIPSYAELYLHTVNRDQISLEDRSISQLDRVVCGTAQFITDASSGSVVSGDFEREFPRIETLFRKLEHVFSDCNVDNLGGGPDCFTIHGQSCALRHRVHRNRYGARRTGF